MFFHGSKHRIKNFTDEFVGARDAVDQEGPGIYFTSSWDDARSYGPYVYTVKLNSRKKVSTQSGKNAPLREIEWLIRQAPEWEENAQNWHENPSIGLKKAAKDFIEYNDSPHQQFMQVWYDFYRYSPKEYVRNMTKLGYDIIYIERNNGVIHAIVLNPSIIEFVEMKDDRTDEEKNKDGLKEIRKFIRKTLSEAFLDKQGVLQDFDFKEEYPYEDIWNLIKDYVEDNYKHWFQLGWSIFDSIIESDKYKSTNVHGSFFKVEKIDEFTNHDYPVLDMLNSDEEAYQRARQAGFIVDEDGIVLGLNGVNLVNESYNKIKLTEGTVDEFHFDNVKKAIQAAINNGSISLDDISSDKYFIVCFGLANNHITTVAVSDKEEADRLVKHYKNQDDVWKIYIEKPGVNSMVLLKKESGWVKKINESLKESYDDVGVDMVKANKKVDEYKNFTDKKIVGDYVYLHFPEKDDWDLWGKIMVFDLNDGTEVANSSYGRKNKFHTLKGVVDVRPDKRRQGIATEMYKWIEELTGEKIYPDTPHSKSAEKFWAQPNRPFGEKSLQENKNVNTQVCENCFHSWKKESSDNDPYLCHICGYDNKKGVFRVDDLKKWQKKHYSKLNEEEEKMKKIVYEALFVDNTSKLKQMFPPVHPNVFYHHMTIAFAPKELKYPENLGQKVRLEIIGRITTDKVDALLVNSSMSSNKYPHITLSTAEGVKPFESNKAFEESPDKIKRFNSPLYIDTTYGYFDGKNKIIN